MIFWPSKCAECGYCSIKIDAKSVQGSNSQITLTCPREQNPCWNGPMPVGSFDFIAWLNAEGTALRSRRPAIMRRIQEVLAALMPHVGYPSELSYVFAPAKSEKVFEAILRHRVYEPNDLDRLREEAAVLGGCYDCDNVKELGQECEVHCSCCFNNYDKNDPHDGPCCPGWGHYNTDTVGEGVSDIEGCGECDKMGDDQALVLHDQTCKQCRVLTPEELKEFGATPTSRGAWNSNYLRIMIDPSELIGP